MSRRGDDKEEIPIETKKKTKEKMMIYPIMKQQHDDDHDHDDDTCRRRHRRGHSSFSSMLYPFLMWYIVTNSGTGTSTHHHIVMATESSSSKNVAFHKKNFISSPLSSKFSSPSPTKTIASILKKKYNDGLLSVRGGGGGGTGSGEEVVLKDPNPMPSIEELEKETTDEMVYELIDQITIAEKGPIIHKYLPNKGWLWRQWYGTVLYHTTWDAVFNMILTFLFCALVRKWTHDDWDIWAFPDQASENTLIARLVLVEKVWKSLLSLTTFLLTFFVGQAYTFFRTVYNNCCSIQGRLSDINLLLAAHAARKSDGSYTKESKAFLLDIANKLRVFHIMMWATQTRRFRILLTERGMNALISRGLLTSREKISLDGHELVPKTQKHFILLEWVLVQCIQARKQKVLIGDAGFEQLLLSEICDLRGSCGSLGSMMSGRMPLAYTHFVQVLVDAVLFFAPVAQCADLGIFSIFSVGMLTIFYSGLLDLAKVFLDPLDNEEYRDGCVNMDVAVLIMEANTASDRWMVAGDKF